MRVPPILHWAYMAQGNESRRQDTRVFPNNLIYFEGQATQRVIEHGYINQASEWCIAKAVFASFKFHNSMSQFQSISSDKQPSDHCSSWFTHLAVHYVSKVIILNVFMWIMTWIMLMHLCCNPASTRKRVYSIPLIIWNPRGGFLRIRKILGTPDLDIKFWFNSHVKFTQCYGQCVRRLDAHHFIHHFQASWLHGKHCGHSKGQL